MNERLKNGLYRGTSVTFARASPLNEAQRTSYDARSNASLFGRRDAIVALLLHNSARGMTVQAFVHMSVDMIKSRMKLADGWKDVVTTLRKNGPAWFAMAWSHGAATSID